MTWVAGEAGARWGRWLPGDEVLLSRACSLLRWWVMQRWLCCGDTVIVWR